MGDYLRTTTECTFKNLNSVLVEALRTHATQYELGNIETAALMCCETTSTKQKKGMFSKAEVIVTSVVLTPQWLIWGTRKDNDAPAILSAKLRDIQVQDYEKSGMYKMMPDTGINLSGLRTDAVDLGSTFIGLGAEPAAQKFRTLLKETFAKA
jgi:hypothetical protein